MKKIIILLLTTALLIFALTGCSGAATPSMSWADAETLTYDVTNTESTEKIGTMVVHTERTTTDNQLNGKSYACNTKTTILLETDKVKVETTILSKAYTALALSKNYTDKVDAAQSYTLEARQVGKNYLYSLNGAAELKLKTGTTYTFSEFIYSYIRCYPLASVPASIKIADPINNSVVAVGCSNTGVTDQLTIAFPDETKVVLCNIVAIKLSGSPVGKSIFVSYIPDKAEYHIQGLSITPSKKIPAKIVENDITYTLTSMKAGNSL